jgi:hypothetical protein
MIHVHPINDIREHDTSDTGNTCLCNPIVILENYEMIVIHNSFDGREGVEWANDILRQPKTK